MKSVRRGQPRRSKVDWPTNLAAQCRIVGLPEPTRELKFHPTRKWRFDLAFMDAKIAVEVDGGVFIQGRHSRGAGIEKDCEKFAEATALGWRVLRVTPRHVTSGQAVDWIERIYEL